MSLVVLNFVPEIWKNEKSICRLAACDASRDLTHISYSGAQRELKQKPLRVDYPYHFISTKIIIYDSLMMTHHFIFIFSGFSGENNLFIKNVLFMRSSKNIR